MIPVEEFRQENQSISELCAVLSPLLEKDDLLTNPIVCELLERFHSKVKAHLEHEARSLYGELLRGHKVDGQSLASEFMGNTHELKRILSKYSKHWCKGTPVKPEDFDDFRQQTSDIFQLVDRRLNLEEKKLFPMLTGA